MQENNSYLDRVEAVAAPVHGVVGGFFSGLIGGTGTGFSIAYERLKASITTVQERNMRSLSEYSEERNEGLITIKNNAIEVIAQLGAIVNDNEQAKMQKSVQDMRNRFKSFNDSLSTKNQALNGIWDRASIMEFIEEHATLLYDDINNMNTLMQILANGVSERINAINDLKTEISEIESGLPEMVRQICQIGNISISLKMNDELSKMKSSAEKIVRSVVSILIDVAMLLDRLCKIPTRELDHMRLIAKKELDILIILDECIAHCKNIVEDSLEPYYAAQLITEREFVKLIILPGSNERALLNSYNRYLLEFSASSVVDSSPSLSGFRNFHSNNKAKCCIL